MSASSDESLSSCDYHVKAADELRYRFQLLKSAVAAAGDVNASSHGV
ncbi:hypothetical protein [Microbacterium sp. BDGP8]|nr:hypothetical protein [Microbacterium sp. BDGP8]WHE35070.1 hypothetical protein P6897_10195 [Microbacterium sp. BDGP8]